MADPGFWGDPKAAQKVLQRRKRIEADLDLLKRLRGQEDDAKVLADWVESGEDVAADFAAGGAELLVNVTNDAWYGTTSAPHQHLAMAAFRAVENRRYLVRAANTGITAVVDPRGRVLEPTRLFDTTVLVREVPLVAETTFYTRHGNVFARACAAMALAVVAATLGRPSTRMDGRRHP